MAGVIRKRNGKVEVIKKPTPIEDIPEEAFIRPPDAKIPADPTKPVEE